MAKIYIGIADCPETHENPSKLFSYIAYMLMLNVCDIFEDGEPGEGRDIGEVHHLECCVRKALDSELDYIFNYGDTHKWRDTQWLEYTRTIHHLNYCLNGVTKVATDKGKAVKLYQNPAENGWFENKLGFRRGIWEKKL